MGSFVNCAHFINAKPDRQLDRRYRELRGRKSALTTSLIAIVYRHSRQLGIAFFNDFTLGK